MFDENSMAERILSGDMGAFGRLVDWYEPTVYQYALGFLGQPDAAENATQESFRRVFQDLDRKHADVKLSIWIFCIVVSVCTDRQRHVRVNKNHFVTEEGESALVLEIERQLLYLQRQQREILLLHDLCGFSDADTAQILGLGEEAIRLRLSRGRRNLRELLLRQHVLENQPEKPHDLTEKDCAAYRELCSQYVDECISDQDKERLLDHIQECGECAAYLNDLTLIGRTLLHMQEKRPPEELRGKIVERAQWQAEHLQSRRVRTSRKLFALGLTVVACFLVLICSGVLGGLFVNTSNADAYTQTGSASSAGHIDLSETLSIPDAVTAESYAFVLAATGETGLPELSESVELIAGDDENSVEYYAVTNDISLVQKLIEGLESIGYEMEAVENNQIVISPDAQRGLIIILHQ